MIQIFGAIALIGIFLDTETNGLDFTVHEAIEIAIELIDLESGKRIESYRTLIQISSEAFGRSDPTSLAFTGITFQELQEGKPLPQVRKEILELFKRHHLVRKEAIFICQNPSFDRIFFTKIVPTSLQEEHNFPYNWLDLASMHWARSLRGGYPIEEIGLSKDMIARFYGLSPEERPHRAGNGVSHLVECYNKVVGYRAPLG